MRVVLCGVPAPESLQQHGTIVRHRNALAMVRSHLRPPPTTIHGAPTERWPPGRDQGARSVTANAGASGSLRPEVLALWP